MTYHHRRSTRLQGYDYSQSGAYFVTLCTHERLHLFGQVVDEAMVLSAIGTIVEAEWLQTAVIRPSVILDMFVVMPNHMHGILVITDHGTTVGATRRVAQQPNIPSLQSNTLRASGLGAIIGQFKSVVTKRVNRLLNPPDHPLWQRNYHDHIIRSEADLNRIREYVLYNPARWQQDSLFS